MRDLLRGEVPHECKHVVLAMTEFAPVARQLRNRGRHGKTLIEPIVFMARLSARILAKGPSDEVSGADD